ncbi:hypothetical protein GZ981_000929 [Clostridium perfringens]|uniref:hypothetical protein n=1 Tax=Clostridium perfringens TaxID=1502 RepID=UPI001A2CBE58|nr:hypothetical protein [Clostridium perfringens]EGT3605883.1 hypothetical protein [Clostridium perfringens]EGT5619760.1 hypothetical protein [Clostridium perfringens]HAT4345370.1 hypothetical protein [Clostridium perfringens]
MLGIENILDIYEQNRSQVLNDENFKMLLNEIKYIKYFIYDFDCLNSNKSYYFYNGTNIVPINVILDSAHRSLNSIQLCCENCNLADAHTLIRKYRDDLFFYLYILYVQSNSDIFSENEINKHEKNIIKWGKDNLKSLNINEILRYIGKSKFAKEAVIKYSLQDSFKKVSENLNNFVHSNGKSFYNKPYNYYSNNNLIKKYVEEIIYEINYITSTFIFLLILIREDYIMSTDYVDSLEIGLNPQEGSQYWVAPFITEYINKKMILISDEWKKYLKSKVSMEI